MSEYDNEIPRTNHTRYIKALRLRADFWEQWSRSLVEDDKTEDIASDRLAADLLEIHDATGISLDNWQSAKDFIEHRLADAAIPFKFQPNES